MALVTYESCGHMKHCATEDELRKTIEQAVRLPPKVKAKLLKQGSIKLDTSCMACKRKKG